ncbi:uncharacterized protein BDZ83DRAFT_640430 [Colletotrichum acutatum]|uniref:Uncharacterized protein n=1 Tax=Glomerella acutata TaxID=27357 RepID=A0AAD8XBV0_GLOAC|nr:uncharacterized protein BDZ83DRAFT_640430 [Colletotrichum acutatum]KAK1710589.1 hypothetical protein BDZ83DRAFT_640430 [Colletotrichum acutatum]
MLTRPEGKVVQRRSAKCSSGVGRGSGPRACRSVWEASPEQYGRLGQTIVSVSEILSNEDYCLVSSNCCW